MAMISIDEFVVRKKLKFKNQKSQVAFFQKLQPDSLVKVGITYFINQNEADELLNKELIRKIKTKKQRAKQARINFKLDKKRKLFQKREEVS